MLKHCVDLVWHGEIAEQQPALYAIIVAVRLLEMRCLLKPAGSFYLHCDPAASHWAQSLCW